MSELTPQAREVLDAARAVPCAPDQAAIERMNKAVLLATGAVGAAGVASAAGATAGKAGVTALSVKLIIVSATVLAVAGGVGVAVSLSRSGEGRGEGKVLAAAPRVEAPAVEATPVEEPKVEQPAVDPPMAAPATPTPKAAIAPKLVAAVKPPAPEVATPPAPIEEPGPNDAFTRELALLEQARTKLQARDWTGVLAAMEIHDAEFPNGTLNAEAEVLRILSLCEVNRVSEALERSKRLQRTAGRSPALLRLAGSCVEP